MQPSRNAAERQKRLRDIEILLLQCHSRTDICRVMQSRYNIAPKTTDKLMSDVRAEWRKYKLTRKDSYILIERVLLDVAAKARTAGKEAIAVRAMDSLMTLYGIKNKVRDAALKTLLDELASLTEERLVMDGPNVLHRLRKNAQKIGGREREIVLGAIEAMDRALSMEQRQVENMRAARYRSATTEQLLEAING